MKIENLKLKSISLFTRLLQLSAFTVLLGRAWQHLYWDAPFRTLLWDEQLLSGLVKQFTAMEWETYITSMEVDNAIGNSIKIFGCFYFISAILILFLHKLPKFMLSFLWLSSLCLSFLALLYCKERFFSIGQFFEYTLQFGSPFFLWWWIRQTKPHAIPQNFLFFLKIATALTFTCHGLYAVGFYPIPVQFMEMTMNILGVDEVVAKTFLTTAGVLDFVVALGIFLPWKWSRFFLIYAVLWGFGTTVARVWANFNWEWLDYVLLQWLHESVMRMPHFLIPLAVLVGGYYHSKEVRSQKSDRKINFSVRGQTELK